MLTTEQHFNNTSFVKHSSQYVKRGLLDMAMVQQIVAATRGTDPIGKAPDSTDLRPSNSWEILIDGQIVSKYWEAAVRKSVTRVSDAVRTLYANNGITPCKCVIRRWGEHERSSLQYHFDSSAFVTAVVSLSRDSDFTGGPFLRSNGRNKFVDLQAGDALIHQYDTWHGVRVESGVRLSLVVWFLETAECRVPMFEQSWYWADAHAGDPIAQDQLAAQYLQRKDLPNAMKWFQLAGNNGNIEAMYRLGTAHAERQEWDRAAHWWRLSAIAHYPDAQNNLGSYLLSTSSGMNDQHEGRDWLLKAAQQGHPTAMFNLGKILGQQGDLPGAWLWWERASVREGLPEATEGLLQLKPILEAAGVAKGAGKSEL